MDKLISFKQGEEEKEIFLKVVQYQSNKRMAILAYFKDCELYGDITINLNMPIVSIDEGFINANVNTSNSNLIQILQDIGIIKDHYGTILYNYGSYDYVKFDLEKLKEYDKKGIEKYLKVAKENYYHILNNYDCDIKI